MTRIGTLEFDFPAVMGVLNVTPDSFSDGGRYDSRDAALRQAEFMACNGAAIVDVGGESTRPGAAEITEQQELDRVMPVVEGIVAGLDIPVSIDTSRPGVMRAAVAAGAALVNDVRALQAPGALETAAELGRPVCLMHMLGEPRTMQDDPRYDDVVADVTQFLHERVAKCESAGLPRERILVDPGFGFGKTVAHNLELLVRLGELREVGCPLLVGLSRKATLGAITGREVRDRMPASVAAALLAIERGAQIVRVHDVAATVDAVRVLRALWEAEGRE